MTKRRAQRAAVTATAALLAASLTPHPSGADLHTTTWTFPQPAGGSPWNGWAFVPAGAFTLPATWGSPVVQWSFNGSCNAWQPAQASLGVANCYLPVQPAHGGQYAMHAADTCAAESQVGGIHPPHTPPFPRFFFMFVYVCFITASGLFFVYGDEKMCSMCIGFATSERVCYEIRRRHRMHWAFGCGTRRACLVACGRCRQRTS